jgi:hypothetical protein
MLRDDDWRGIGYTLFGLLLLLGLLAIERQASHAGGKRNELGKKRRVYTLDPEKAWARRRPSRDLATT